MRKYKVCLEKAVKTGEKWEDVIVERIVEADYYTVYHNGEIGFERSDGEDDSGYPNYRSVLCLKYWDSVEEIEP